VPEEKSVDHLIEQCLDGLGISHLSEWDVLLFLNRHGTSLASVEHISRLIGYSKVIVANALNKLESGGLVQRSRASHGVRYYGLAGNLNAIHKDCFQPLMELADKRSTRVVVAKRLQQFSSTQLNKRTSL
jgi:predicted transcriptional regulator